MFVPLVCLLLLATIGVTDSAYYHTYKFRLFEQPSSRVETLTHIARAFAAAVTIGLLSHYRPVGGWYWLVAGVLGFDFVINVVDVVVEPKSRAPLGGLPPPEYLIHMVVMAFAGGATCTFLALGYAGRLEPSALLAPEHMPTWLVWYARVVVVGAVLSGIGDSVRLLVSVKRSGWRPAVSDG
jgi:hypothetical protein